MQHEHQRCQLNSDVTTCSSQSFDASMEANPKEQVLLSCKHSDEDEVLASAASEGENAKVCCLLMQLSNWRQSSLVKVFVLRLFAS